MVYLTKIQVKRSNISLSYVLLCLILGTSYVIPSVNSESCTSPLGMEDGRIKNSRIRVSSVRPSTTSSGEQARLRKNIPAWGAWCPDTSRANKLSADEYIEVDLLAPTKITAIATQGREYNNANQLFRKYILSFSNDGRTWNFYNKDDGSETFNGAKVFDGTGGSASQVVRKSLQATARYIRVHPCYIRNGFHQCMRLEVYGCAIQTVILSYSMPVGQSADGKVHYKDTSYNGVITNDFYRKDGTGILTDGKFGPTDAKEISGKGWVGWSSTLTQSSYIAITFEFSEMRKFKDITLTVNVDKKNGNAVFYRSRILFASTEDGFSAMSFLQYCPKQFPYNDDPYIANVTLPLCDNTARFIKVQLYFGGKWLLITEVKFNSVPASRSEMLMNCTGNTTNSCALIPPTSPTQIYYNTSRRSTAPPQASTTSKPGCEDCTTPLEGKQASTEIIITSVAVTVPLAIVLVVLFVILIIYKRRRQSPKLSTTVPAGDTVMQNPRMRPLPQPLQNNQELEYVIPVDVGSAPDVPGYIIPIDGGTAPDELGYANPVVVGSAPDELSYVIPVDGGTATREEVQMSQSSDYTELDRSSQVEGEATNADSYQKLSKCDSDYVIPAEPEPIYQHIS